eukprot:gene21945-30166_t
MVYHLQLSATSGSVVQFLGLQLDTADPLIWLGATLLLVSGVLAFRPVQRRFALQWDAAQAEIEQALQLRDLRKSFGKTGIIRGANLAVRP